MEPWLDRGRHVQTARGFGGSRPKSFLRHAEDSTLQLMLDLSEDQEPGHETASVKPVVKRCMLPMQGKPSENTQSYRQRGYWGVLLINHKLS